MSVNRYQMIAIDFDGTLLTPAGKVSPRTRSAIRRVLDAGWLVCFATGRNITESRVILDAVDHYPTAVFAGGAIVIDTNARITMHRTTIEPNLARELTAFLDSHGMAAMALQDVESAGVDYFLSAAHAIDPGTQAWMTMTRAKVQTVERLSEHDHEHTMRLSVVGPPGQIAIVEQQLAEKFGDRIFSYLVHVPAVGVDVIEVFDPSVNKWAGILKVAEHHGIDPAHIIAVGDDTNDLAMLHGAGLGVVMGNARDEIKAIAGRVIGSNADDGLAEFLDELADARAVMPLAEVDQVA